MLNFVVDVLLPPTSLAVLALLLLLLGGRRARALATVLVGIVVLLAVPAVSFVLLETLAPSEAASEGPAPAAIVVLSADAIRRPGPADLEPGSLTLDRIRAGAMLQRNTGLPLLVSGGPTDSIMTLAGMMARSLKDDFGVDVQWQEGHSRDTWENAIDSAAVLRPTGIKRVYVVTHYWHMRRAVLAFRAAGLDPVPAPVRPPYQPPLTIEQFVPRPSAWYSSYIAVHEWIGLTYYKTRQ